MKSRLILLSVLVMMVSSSHAQLLFNSDVSVTLTGGITLTVLGDISNTGSTAINNGGNITLNGNWENNTGTSLFGSSSGTVIFNGSSQSIGGTTPTLFHNLEFSGSPLVTMFLDVSAGGFATTGIFNAGSGTLNLNKHILTINNPFPSGIAVTTGGILAEQVDNSSRVRWNIGSAGGNHEVPFINATGNSVPVGIHVTSGNAGQVEVTTYATSAANTPLPASPETVTHIRNNAGIDNSLNMVDRFWYLEKSDPAGVATLTFTYAPGEVAASGNLNPRAQRWSAPADGWFAVSAGQSNPGPTTVTVPLVSTFGTWAIANEPSPLPVELLAFDAKPNQNKKVDIYWVTAVEINNDFFTVERSGDGNNFHPVATVPGAGNSNSVLHYTAIDENPLNGISYYRLKQTDFDGAVSFSRVVSVKFNEGGNSISIYPNPVKEALFISFDQSVSEKTKFELLIYDASGRRVTSSQLIAIPGEVNIFRISRGSLAPGVYKYTLVQEGSNGKSGKLLFQ